MIKELKERLDKKEITSKELFDEAIKKAKKYQSDYNSFVTITEEYKNEDSTSLISGIPYALKDNYSTKGILTTGSSKILEDYVPVFDSTVYKKLKESGAVLIGKTVLDELAMGGTGTTGHTGINRNPWDKTRITGGSSSGSAAVVALGIVPFALGSDTGDSIRKPAAYCGVVGFKPTYGRISRYGIFPYASSLDTAGVLARSVEDVAVVTDIIKGNDSEHDMTTLKDDDKIYSELLDRDVRGKKLFYIKEICDKSSFDNIDDEFSSILDNFNKTVDKCKKLGIEVDEVSIDKSLLEAVNITYFIISCAEATSNNANLTGLLFGPRSEADSAEEMMFKARTKGFSEFIKRRFVIGSYVLQKENQEKLFLNAQRIRRMITDKINALLESYDGFILPCSSSVAPKIENIDENKYLIMKQHLAIANFGGYPSITIPSGFVNNMPVGINITGRIMEDDVVLNIAKKLEDEMEYKNQTAKVGEE